jgi:hypothetical protein
VTAAAASDPGPRTRFRRAERWLFVLAVVLLVALLVLIVVAVQFGLSADSTAP